MTSLCMNLFPFECILIYSYIYTYTTWRERSFNNATIQYICIYNLYLDMAMLCIERHSDISISYNRDCKEQQIALSVSSKTRQMAI